MNLLALDLGTRTGWALSESRRIESGVQTFDVKRGESPGMRYVRFNRWLEEVAQRPAKGRVFDLIVYEQTHNRGGAATEIAAGFATRVQEFCVVLGAEHAAVHSATLKKFTTGSGRGEKITMFQCAKVKQWLPERLASEIYGKEFEDEVDAICLLHYALAELVPAGTHGAPAPREARDFGMTDEGA